MRMRIAQVSPLFESVPPQFYGGTERVVFWLTEELVRRGHDVTLFASGDSNTRAKLVAGCPRSLRLDGGSTDHAAHHVLLMEYVMQRADDFDVIHFHTDYQHFPLARRMRTLHITTQHGRLDMPDLVPVFREFSDVPVVSISDAQRRPLAGANWIGTVHHGLPLSSLSYSEGDEGYLAFLGRISPEKQVDHAIRIAEEAGMPLRIAAKVSKEDHEYFKMRIEPLLDSPLVEFVGEIGEAEKNDFLGGACALLFPICWPEPFGLVMIEAMACGTPVIAYRHGSVPEIIEDGVSGYVVSGPKEAAEAVRGISGFDRRRCRESFENRFSDRRMADDYLRLYQSLLGAEPGRMKVA